MEHKAESILDKLLYGHAEGFAVALRGCPEAAAAAMTARFGESTPGRVRLFEPCRVEHPHSAFLRKSIESHGKPAVQTTLYAPDGRLTEERSAEGEALERFVKKPADFETLRGHLKDVELHPVKMSAAAEDCTALAHVGLTPVRDMETRWAGPELTAWALMTQDEAAASCLRKLERQLHRRCEEACRAGCHAGILHDLAVEPLPETYMLHAGRHIEWMRHAGLTPWVEVLAPEPMLLAALAAAHAGVRISLDNPALHDEAFAPPEGMKFIFDVAAGDDLVREPVAELLKKCACAVLLVDCHEATEAQMAKSLEILLTVIQPKQ
jgi:hypothetical protein